MNKQKSIIAILLVTTLMFSIMMVSAVATVEPPSFWENLFSIFSSGPTFTIVGQDLHASDTRDALVNVTAGASTNLVASNYCSSGHALFDVYAVNLVSGEEHFFPRWETKDVTSFICGATNLRCAVEVYCVPHPDCTSNANCVSWIGTGSTCATKTTDQGATMPLKTSDASAFIDSYKYCTPVCTGASKTCYRINAGNTACESATYDCSYSTYSTIISSNCVNGAGSYIFGSAAACNDAIANNQQCTPGEQRNCVNDNGVSGYQVCSDGSLRPAGTWGNCIGVIKNCSAQSGNICSTTQSCAQSFVSASDTERCCIGTCTGLNDGSCTVGGQTIIKGQSKCISDSTYTCSSDGSNIITSKPGCCNWAAGEKLCADFTCKASCSNDTSANLDSMTWSQFYSISNKDFVSTINACGSNSECGFKEGYNVSCVSSGSSFNAIRDRFVKANQEGCDFSMFTKLIGGIQKFFLGSTSCEIFSNIETSISLWWNSHVQGTPGFCIAESTSTTGKIWDSILKTVGGFGIPAQWVLISTIGIFLLIVVLIISKI